MKYYYTHHMLTKYRSDYNRHVRSGQQTTTIIALLHKSIQQRDLHIFRTHTQTSTYTIFPWHCDEANRKE